MELSIAIKEKALESGFDLAGITTAEPIDSGQTELLKAWLKAGFAGQMTYMHRNFQKRVNPAMLLKGAQSVIVVGLNYNPPKQLKTPVGSGAAGRVANYAQYENYHQFIKKNLRKLVEFTASFVGTGFRFKICVDSTPLAERALAARAGVGFIGKNHILTNPELGGWILLGEIITSLKLRPDRPNAEECSDCHKCISACPTHALRPDGRFDANKCISYLTTEYKGQIPCDLAGEIGDRVFGCDECISACPYQQKAPPCRNKNFKFHPDRARLDLQGILDSTAEQFEAEFADSCFKRVGLEQLKRNARICLANVTGGTNA